MLLREVPAVFDAYVLLVAVVDDQGRNGNERQDVADVELQDHLHLGNRDTRASGEALELPPVLPDAWLTCLRRREVGRESTGPHCAPDGLE